MHSNKYRRRLINKTSLDVGQNLHKVLACFDVALRAASKVLNVVLVGDEVGGRSINISSRKNVAAGLPSFDPDLHEGLRSQTAGSCQPFDR
jgi:hypothetical protein